MKVLVTGAVHGLGRAFLEHAIARGNTVVAVDRDAAGLAELEHHYPREVTAREVDLADEEGVRKLTADMARFFRFDMALLNAGISATGPFESIPFEASVRLVRVNVSAPLVMASGLVGGGAMNKRSTLVFVSSLSHAVGYPGAAAYAASKDAVSAYAEAVRRPFRKRGVRVTTVYPGPLRTLHAERHAPPGARAEGRMAPEVAARKIWRAARKGERYLHPGLAAKTAGSLGRLMPATATRLMRKVIYEKLDESVW